MPKSTRSPAPARRPAAPEAVERTTISFSPSEGEQLRVLAGGHQKTVSRYLVDLALSPPRAAGSGFPEVLELHRKFMEETKEFKPAIFFFGPQRLPFRSDAEVQTLWCQRLNEGIDHHCIWDADNLDTRRFNMFLDNSWRISRQKTGAGCVHHWAICRPANAEGPAMQAYKSTRVLHTVANSKKSNEAFVMHEVQPLSEENAWMFDYGSLGSTVFTLLRAPGENLSMELGGGLGCVLFERLSLEPSVTFDGSPPKSSETAERPHELWLWLTHAESNYLSGLLRNFLTADEQKRTSSASR